jgi:hypothetical protein
VALRGASNFLNKKLNEIPDKMTRLAHKPLARAGHMMVKL